MSVVAITREQAIERVGRSLGLDGSQLNGEVSPALVGQALRRAASILAPCARYEIERSVRQTLQHLKKPGTADLMVEDVLESLIVYRDLLEMRTAVDEIWTSTDIVVRPAAPSFVSRGNGSVVILGTTGDVITPVPVDLPATLVHYGALRLLIPRSAESLAPRLEEFGLIELGEKAWLRLPKVERPGDYIAGWRRRVQEVPHESCPEGLLICKRARSGGIYRDRWSRPGLGDTGLFVARRPQRFGADLWCLVELNSNFTARILDLFSSGDMVRPCDIAWQIQMAMDACEGVPQSFRCRLDGDLVAVDFFSPIPSWAERRLLLAGRRRVGAGCLFSYEMETVAVDDERTFLRESLWLAEHN